MTPGASLGDLVKSAPKLSDAKAARKRLADFANVIAGPRDWLDKPEVRDLLLGIADHSPFLWDLVLRDAKRFARLIKSSPTASLESCVAGARVAGDNARDDAELMRALRLARQEAALLIALADIGGVWNVDEVVEALTRFADAAVRSALRFLLRKANGEGRLNIADPSDPERECGLVVLALGKHGARELNYSSDIDIIVFFDPGSSAVPVGVAPSTIYVRLTKALARLLQERTADDYVLRVDLRLRPDPGSTAVAISLPAAFSYYETLGQNWERAALIKARPVAGDVDLGARLLSDLAPFIWRKYFDYAAIADIHAMKRQIHAVRGHAEVAVAGHNVKLGRGGIREVEFFTQTQQLIFGGRRPNLRGARTLEMLEELERDGWIIQSAVEDLSLAYRYLRMIEHRLQMIADEQTQRLPEDERGLAKFARFLGHARLAAFEKELTHHLKKVEFHYARLFEHAPGLDTRAGSLVFTGVVDDPETLETLALMGFVDASRAIETVRGWHFGRRPSIQSARAREVLTELIPALFEAFSGSGDPDAALATFDEALAHMSAAIELFSILKSNAAVRELFADILGGAPRLASVIAQRPHVLDAAIDPSVVNAPIDGAAYDARVASMAREARTPEAFLDGARDVAREEMFLIGVRALAGAIEPARAGFDFTALAQSLLRATLALVREDFRIEYGFVPGGRCVVVGMGRLGSREMTATSDLDLILIYDFEDAAIESDGPRQIHPALYYTKLTQRLITALTAATRRGTLYDVDMRLRPSGRQGPVATRFSGFKNYQTSEAETWEHMALTRARVVAGDESLALEVDAFIQNVIRSSRDIEKLRRDARDMRRLIAKEKGEHDAWDLKLAAGGLMDIEFIVQYLALRYAREWPSCRVADCVSVIEGARAHGVLRPDTADKLRDAHTLLSAVTQLTRITIEGKFDPAGVAPNVLRRIALAVALPDFGALDAALRETRRRVREIFNSIMSRDQA